jgi:hypothetical protein
MVISFKNQGINQDANKFIQTTTLKKKKKKSTLPTYVVVLRAPHLY